MSRFFIPPTAIRGKSFVLSGSEAHHALNVLRKKVGDAIDLFDGEDLSFRGRIESVVSQEIRGTIVEALPPTSLPVQLTLFQALTRGPKWEWLLEKACEVGVAKVVPVFTQRTLIKLDAAQAREKQKRWNRIALAASKQCGRSDLMSVDAPCMLATALERLEKSQLSLIPWEKETQRTIHEALSILFPLPPKVGEGVGEGPITSAVLPSSRPSPILRTGERERQSVAVSQINLFIGPEGGWDAREIDLAKQAGAIHVRLGPTLLRTETAGIVAATLVLREFGVY